MPDHVATTMAGTIQGREKDGAELYAGVPYAAPPSGAGRFRPPQPVEPWGATRDATRFGPVPWQTARGLGSVLSGPEPDCDEDCLTLNVVTPSLDPPPGTDGRPVMVWIHGGGFTSGSGSTPWYRGAALARRGDVVVVTINYRLGALGFLHLAELGGEAYASSGLSGILDQVAALEWVRDNIANFGGDPNNVTIFGESAGAMSVGTLLGLPAARGLFHRAIAESGAAHNVLSADVAAQVTSAFCSLLGTDDMTAVLGAEPSQLLEIQTALPEAMRKQAAGTGIAYGIGMALQPVVDGVHLPRPPLEAIADGLADVPLMVGTNLDEWHLFAMGNPGPKDDEGIVRRLDRMGRPGAELLAGYRAGRPDAATEAVWSAMMTDFVFRIPAVRLLEAQAAVRPDDTYGYWFTWASPAFGGRLGSCHALEIPFVFGTLDQRGADVLLGPNPPRALSDTMQDAWLSFARDGHPDPAGLPEPWPAYDTDRRAMLELGDDVHVVADPDADERALWEGRR